MSLASCAPRRVMDGSTGLRTAISQKNMSQSIYRLIQMQEVIFMNSPRIDLDKSRQVSVNYPRPGLSLKTDHNEVRTVLVYTLRPLHMLRSCYNFYESVGV